ncbi:MAG TPA: hypothetical protein VK573_07315 [Gemmatimonadales bacterium]|nr:hypothetical protein [Gemmatimonadales bacterium]
MLIVVVLFATVMLRAGIVIVVVYVILPATRTCPRCATDLTLIRHPVMRRLLPVVEHRWCLGCGWSGLVRRVSRERPVFQSRVINRAARS